MRAWSLAIVLAGCSQVEPVGGDAALVPDAPGERDADLTAPTDTPFVACTDPMSAVYAAAPQPDAALGSILACAVDAKLDEPTVAGMVGSGVVVTSAVAQFRIAFQTRTSTGTPAVSTARVYLPSTPRARPVPLVVAAHGSVGLADGCAPSTDVDSSLPLPFAGRGFAAIAPDLAGLGNAGTQAYLDNRAQGRQLLDASRALRALLAPGITADELVLTGYSQGGGAALSAHSLIGADGPGAGHLVATVVYAAQWPIRIESFDYVTMLRDPSALTIGFGLAFSSIAVLRQYAFFENHLGAGRGKDSAPPSLRSGLDAAIQSQCLLPLGGWIQTKMLHTGDLIDPTLRAGVLACIDGQPGCTGDAAAYHAFLLANELPAQQSAGPVLLVQGLADQIMPPASEAACIFDKLSAAGVDVDTCVVSGATHTNIMDRRASGVAWAESVYGGGPRVRCTQSASLPACN